MKAIEVHHLSIKMDNSDLIVSGSPQRGNVEFAHHHTLAKSCYHELKSQPNE
jgi:hypothetical protein